MSKPLGTVYLVGAGPGAPDLLTLRAAELLSRADAVVYDRLIHPQTLARVGKGTRLIFCGKEGGGHQTPQAEINATLIAQARAGRLVVRLKGGDPFVFGRGAEEALALAAAGVPFEVVPGVSSGLAGPAAAGIPVTHRGAACSVTLATARLAEGAPDWASLARAETLVLFMVGDQLAQITAALVRAGRPRATPSAVVEAATWEDQSVVQGTLGTVAALARKHRMGSPALLISGEVVRLRAQLGALVRGTTTLEAAPWQR